MIEINSETKAKFYAQYWGQDVAVLPSYKYGDRATILDAIALDMEESYLELKPISSISDSELRAIADICGYYPENIEIYRRESEIRIICDEHVKVILSINEANFAIIRRTMDSFPDEFQENEVSHVVDSLRLNRYLVPWMGLSCKELINAGWAKYGKEQ